LVDEFLDRFVVIRGRLLALTESEKASTLLDRFLDEVLRIREETLRQRAYKEAAYSMPVRMLVQLCRWSEHRVDRRGGCHPCL
jgi:nitroimidazol reductase NimA-like FMN-containing flavoprotein (pyridoxamine 5'-phosphate oxidase superfamily)